MRCTAPCSSAIGSALGRGLLGVRPLAVRWIVRIAIVAESFLPHMHGVTRSTLEVLPHLRAAGHSVVVIAAGHGAPTVVGGIPVLHVPSVGLPGYPQVRVALATKARLRGILEAFGPDVVHLASPFVLGYAAGEAARSLGIPVVAVYQTDVPAFTARYDWPWLSQRAWARVCAIHGSADLTLAPSRAARRALTARGIEGVRVWGRGVDAELFAPRRRSAQLRAHWAPRGEVVVGYHGRLAPEKQLTDLTVLADLPGTTLVLVGDGPMKPRLRAEMPTARFTGHLDGDALGAAVASFDIMVHPGESETYCQAVQEALSAGVPVVAPGIGGPAELVSPSHTGWLYRPGDLAGLRARVLDLVGDEHKRAAFGVAARAAVAGRSWADLSAQLVEHYQLAIGSSRSTHEVRTSGGDPTAYRNGETVSTSHEVSS